jgi:hypothetical protein
MVNVFRQSVRPVFAFKCMQDLGTRQLGRPTVARGARAVVVLGCADVVCCVSTFFCLDRSTQVVQLAQPSDASRCLFKTLSCDPPVAADADLLNHGLLYKINEGAGRSNFEQRPSSLPPGLGGVDRLVVSATAVRVPGRLTTEKTSWFSIVQQQNASGFWRRSRRLLGCAPSTSPSLERGCVTLSRR